MIFNNGKHCCFGFVFGAAVFASGWASVAFRARASSAAAFLARFWTRFLSSFLVTISPVISSNTSFVALATRLSIFPDMMRIRWLLADCERWKRLDALSAECWMSGGGTTSRQQRLIYFSQLQKLHVREVYFENDS